MGSGLGLGLGSVLGLGLGSGLAGGAATKAGAGGAAALPEGGRAMTHPPVHLRARGRAVLARRALCRGRAAPEPPATRESTS